MLLATLLALTPLAGADEYAAPWAQSAWRAHSSPFLCRLEHPVPHYGSAAFEQAAATDLAFVLHSRRPLPQVGHAEVVARPAAWQHGQSTRAVGLAIPAAQATLRLEGEGARSALQELQQGRFAAFSYPDAAARGGYVHVAVAALGFRQALHEFEECRRDLRPLDYGAVRETRLHFPFDSAALDAQAVAQLARVAHYIQADPTVSALRIAGHTDDQGRSSYNLRLSERRAAAVREQLVRLGVPEALIDKRYYGESRPRVPNTDDAARAQNRRAVVIVLRADAAS